MDKKETQEAQLAKIVVDSEYVIGQRNQDLDNIEFESVLDMFEMKRTEKDYEWLSDIFLPELPAMILTDASSWANQYFQSRDFVDVLLEGDDPESKSSSKCVKKLINKTLNNKDIYYYQKYMRMRLINSLAGSVWLKCWWEQESIPAIEGTETIELDVDIYGNQIIDRLTQEPATQEIPKQVTKTIIDRFNFDVIDPRNVYTDNKYVYSAQQKDWVIVRSEMSLEELVTNAPKNGYFNLDKLKSLKTENETETSKETYNSADSKQEKVSDTPIKYFDVLERFGKFWCVVKERNENGNPLRIDIGLEEDGTPSENAELIETIITFAVSGNSKTLIRFQPCPFLDPMGFTFRPLIRGLCYIHPTKDTGMSSGKYLREQQIAINDTFNMSQDRVKLATLPVMKGRRYALEDNASVYIEPEHTILLDDPSDLQELEIRSDIRGALEQIGLLKQGMQQVEAIFPTTMGDMPGKASTTATAIAGAENKGTARSNYKSLTAEYTLLIELYNMIISMANQFMRPETAIKVMGQDVYNWNPIADYSFQPVSSNIETEHNKYKKIQIIDQMIGRVVNTQNPKTPVLVNKLLGMAFEFLGQEYQEFAHALLDENAPMKQEGTQPTDMQEMATSNQNGVPQSNQEEMTRMMQGGMQ